MFSFCFVHTVNQTENQSKFILKLRDVCYLGGLLTALNLVNAGLSQSDPVRDALQLAPIPLYIFRNPEKHKEVRL